MKQHPLHSRKPRAEHFEEPAQPKRGRPALPPEEKLQKKYVRFDRELRAKIEATAARLKVPEAQVLRGAVELGFRQGSRSLERAIAAAVSS